MSFHHIHIQNNKDTSLFTLYLNEHVKLADLFICDPKLNGGYNFCGVVYFDDVLFFHKSLVELANYIVYTYEMVSLSKSNTILK